MTLMGAALLRVPSDGVGGWGGAPSGVGAQLNREPSSHSHPTTKAPKTTHSEASPSCRQAEHRSLQTSSTNQERHLVAVMSAPTQATGACPAWTPRSAARLSHPSQRAPPPRPAVLPEDFRRPTMQGDLSPGSPLLWSPGVLQLK